ncbi:MAG: MATE family efflux transporter [Planctomycetaceae bacterium]|nr:MATE family efflux transporter [Planctomycetaceae bacterium]
MTEPDKPLPAASPLLRGRDLTTGSIPRHLIIFSLPMLAGNALQMGHSLINLFWVGRYLGENAVAAVTVSMPVVFVLISAGMGLTLASSILISQHYGAKDEGAIRRVVNSSTILIGACSLVLVAAGELLTPAILRAMDTQEDVLPLAEQYMRIFLLSLPMGYGLFLTRSMLQGIGDSRTPLYYQAAAVAINAALDPLLMFGWLGLPALGLNGTAWATLIAQGLALGALVVVLRRQKNLVAPAASWKAFDGHTALITTRIGFPSALQQSLVSVSMVFVTGIVNGFGGNATAAFGIAGRIDMLAFMPALALSMAVSMLAGQNIGARKHHRVRQIVLWGCVLSGGFTLAASALAVSIPETLMRVFISDSGDGALCKDHRPPAASGPSVAAMQNRAGQPGGAGKTMCPQCGKEVVELGAGYLRIVGSCYVFFAFMFVTNGVINGAGHTMVTTVFSLVSLWVVRVPMALWLADHMGITGVWYAMAASFAVSMLASFAYYLSGRWRKTVVRRPVPDLPAAAFGEESGEV